MKYTIAANVGTLRVLAVLSDQSTRALTEQLTAAQRSG